MCLSTCSKIFHTQQKSMKYVLLVCAWVCHEFIRSLHWYQRGHWFKSGPCPSCAQGSYSKKLRKRTRVWGVQADFVLRYWVFSAKSENVFKGVLKWFLKRKYCIDYQQIKTMCKHNILIYQWFSCQHVVSAAKKNVIDRR